MKLGIMQPYFFPYIGYFQLMKAVDKYIVYDNIQYTKKGWINRNRILVNGKDAYISISLRNDSDYCNICERIISNSFDKRKLLNQIVGSYRKSSYFEEVFPVIESIVLFDDDNLFGYLINSLKQICKFIGIETEFIISSTIGIDHSLKSSDKVLAFCENLGATTYYNAIGGIELYDKKCFSEKNINLMFLDMDNICYKQYENNFVSNLSIVDVLMFNSIAEIDNLLTKYQLK